MFKKKNLAIGTLSAQLLADGLSLVLQTDEGLKFPATGETNIFVGVIWGAAYSSPEKDATSEFVVAYRSSGDTFTITRAQEGTSAKQWEIGDNFMLTASKAVFEEIENAIPVKAAGTDLDTGTDETKFATAKAIKDAHNVPSVAPGTSGNVLTSDGTDWTSAASGAFSFEGAWVTSTYYKVNDCVQQNGSGYVCMTAHTSGTFATDLAAGKWELFVQGGEAQNETITILPMSSYSNTNWGTVELSTATPGNMRNVSSGDQNAEIAFNVALSAGTWKLLLGSTVDGNRGIYSVRIDDNEVGTIDGYAAAPGVGFTGVTGITIASTGVKKLSLKMATKNALSSGYYGVSGVILLIKTA